MSLYDRRTEVGDGVVLIRDMRAERVNQYQTDLLTAGTQFVVTRAYNNRVQVRTVQLFESEYDARPRGRSYTFGRDELDYDDAAVAAAQAAGVVTRRRLGKKPEDTEDMTYIGIDHPGIQWLFEDMGRFATEQGYCPQYDALCARLGIPGRPRPFTVSRTVNGIDLTTTVNARSQAEANRVVDVALGLVQEGPSEADSATPVESEITYTPAA